MVKKFFGILSREVSGVHSAAYLLAFFTILSQVLALFRDRLFAHAFGAGKVLDIYYASFKIPDFLFVTVASLVSISVLVPFIMERLKADESTLREFTSSLFSFFLILMIVVSAVTFFVTPFLLTRLFPGLLGEPGFSDLVTLTRIMLFSPILLGFSNFFASITQAFRRFVIYAISPLLYNLGIILGIIVLYPYMGTAGLAWGVVLGAVMHFALQVPFVYTRGFFPRLRTMFDFKIIKEVVLLSVGRTFALSTSNIATIFLLAMGSLMTVGSIAVFNLSWNMQSVPLAIVGASYSVALFPTISKYFAEGQREKFVSEMLTACRHIVFWSLPVTVLFIVLRAQIVRTILGSGAFSWSDTRLVAASLAVFSVSIVAQSLVLLFVRAYYASGRTKMPLFINLISGIAVVVFSYALWKLFLVSDYFRFFIEHLLRVDDISGTEALMLPLGYSLATLLNLVLFWYAFHKEVTGVPLTTFPLRNGGRDLPLTTFSLRKSGKGFSRSLLKTFFQSFSSAIIMGFVSYVCLQWLAQVFDLETVAGIFAQGLFAGIVGIAVGIIVLVVLKNEELTEVWKIFHQKIWKTKVIVSEETL